MCKALLPLCGFCVPTFLKELFVGQANEDLCPFFGGAGTFWRTYIWWFAYFIYLIFAQHLVLMFEGIFDMETCDLKQSEKQTSLLCLSSELCRIIKNTDSNFVVDHKYHHNDHEYNCRLNH